MDGILAVGHDGAVIGFKQHLHAQFPDAVPDVAAQFGGRVVAVQPLILKEYLHAAAADPAGEGHGTHPGVDMG